MLTDLQFAYLPLDELKPDPRNPRTHSKKQVAQIADSISELGFAGAILINPDRTIIAGHGRYRALKLLGLASVATITVTGLSLTGQIDSATFTAFPQLLRKRTGLVVSRRAHLGTSS